MSPRRSDFDVSNRVKTTDAIAVNTEINRIYGHLYPGQETRQLDQAFRDATSLYQGKYPGYRGCDTPYHDIQHVLDVTLAMARLIDGYECGGIGVERLDAPLFRLGVVVALFHDCGYLLKLDDTEHGNGGEVTLTHVSRGADFLRQYLPGIGMGDVADVAARLIHFTGFETPVAKIDVPTLRHKLLGNLLGSADIIAQMSDRCYLEKCRDRLYPEFVAGGVTTKHTGSGEVVVFSSPEDLVIKTPQFYRTASRRLDSELGGAYRYAKEHFGGNNLYMDAVKQNVRFAERIGQDGKVELRRHPPSEYF